MVRALRVSGATPGEVATPSPADALLPDAADRWVRCITVDAPPSVVYRWLCQLTVAPYSFDLIDYTGRRSPPTLTPGADDLQVGQPFLVFTLEDFVRDRYLAGRSRPGGRYGTIAVSYAVRPLDDGGTRLQSNACLAGDRSAWRRNLLAAGDRVMSGRQLRRLRRLAERTARESR